MRESTLQKQALPLPAAAPTGEPWLLGRIALHYFALFVMVGCWVGYYQLFLAAHGFDKSRIGLLQGVGDLFGIAGPLVAGYLADRLGRPRGLLLAAVALYALALAALQASLQAAPAPAQRFWLALPAVAAMGYAYRSAIPLTDALVSRALTDPSHQYGRVRVAGSAGFIAVFLAIRVFGLVDTASAGSILLAMLLSAGLCLLTGRGLPTARKPSRPTAGIAPGPAVGAGAAFGWIFWVWLGLIFLAQFGMSAHYSFFSLYLKERLGRPNALWLWAVGPMAEVPLIFFAGRIVRRFGLPAMMVAATLAVSVRLGVYAMLPTLWAVGPVQVLHAFTFGVFHTSSIEFVNRQVAPARRAMGMALYGALGVGAASLIGAPLAGFVIDRWGYQRLYLLYALPPLVSAAAMLLLAGRLNVPVRGAQEA